MRWQLLSMFLGLLTALLLVTVPWDAVAGFLAGMAGHL